MREGGRTASRVAGQVSLADIREKGFVYFFEKALLNSLCIFIICANSP